MSRSSRKKFIRAKNECEIELQMSTMLTFKYYEHHVMSRKFKCRYIDLKNTESADMQKYHNFFKASKTFDKLEILQVLKMRKNL